jgi:hypothetical protein
MSEFSKNFMKWCASKTSTFIETGTFKGATTYIASQYFDQVMSVELDQLNYVSAKYRLGPYKNIELYQGDSLSRIEEMIENAKGPITFWLDAHPMDPNVDAACPLLEELEIIAKSKNKEKHIILIDDLQRSLRGEGDYPPLVEMETRLKKINPSYFIKQLPFKTWQEAKYAPTILCASPIDISFPPKFYRNSPLGLW